MTRLATLCKALGQEACIIEHPIDLFYLTGLQLSAGKLCVHADESILFVDGRYLQICQEKAPVKVCYDEREAIASFFAKCPCKRLYFDPKNTLYDSFLRWQELLRASKIELCANSALFQQLRMIKDHKELDKMRKSALLLWKGFDFLLTQFQEGITEKELARRFEIFSLQNGAEGLAFQPIIAFGAHSAMPHYQPDETPLQENSLVLIDIGVSLDHYHSDMTRVVFYKRPDPELKRLYQINKAGQEAALALCRPGVKLGTLDRAARDVMAREGVEQLYVHSLGHGIGLQTHEHPRIKWDGIDKDLVLEPGMVFTVEPGLYVAGKGGVRYEDTVVITASGYENFYPDAGEKIINIL